MKRNRCCEGIGLILRFYIFLIPFTFFLNIPLTSYSETEDVIIASGFSKDEINRGRRFFMGLLPFERDHEACISCHYMYSPDTLNWNPSAIDIAQKFAGRDSAAFHNAVMQPTGQVMQAAHMDFELNEEDIQYIKTYLDNLAVTGVEPMKPSFNLLLVFIFLGVLITWALLDLIIFKKVKIKAIPILIFLGAFAYQLYMLSNESIMLGRSQGYQPDQPIKFSHQVHMAENQMDCMYCHHTATTSKSANIPSTNLCMNCHIVVREGSRSGRFEIDKIVQAFEEGRSVEWIRVHDLPDHVFFSHAQHVGAGKLDCMQCHGDVENMHVVRQVNDLSMGWCLDCHRTTKVDFIENDYYSIFEAFHADLEAGVRDSILAAEIGANNCSSCHY
jgi:hypothetical protein